MQPIRLELDPRRHRLHARLREAACRATVPGSLPVLFFGDLPRASVATIGLNPSDREYLSPSGELLTGNRQRFATLNSLSARERAQLTDSQCDAAIESMRHYFGPERPVYWWFGALARVVSNFGASFAEGSAAHLDLVQEATRPTWSELPEAEREALLARDLPFLDWQLRAFPLQAVLCTSKTVANEVRTRFQIEVHRQGQLQRVRWWVGRARIDGREVTFAGWNLPLARPTGLGAEGEAALGRLLANTPPAAPAQIHSPSRAKTMPSPNPLRSSPDEHTLRKVAKDQPISRREFEHALTEWAARAHAHHTIGDTTGRGQKAWVHVRDGGRLYYLNADSKKDAVDQYLGMLALAPELGWSIVANQRGRRNKVAFGPEAVVIAGFYFYVED